MVLRVGAPALRASLAVGFGLLDRGSLSPLGLLGVGCDRHLADGDGRCSAKQSQPLNEDIKSRSLLDARADGDF